MPILGILYVPGLVLMPLVTVYMSKFVVEMVTNNADPGQFLLLILGFSAVLLLLKVVDRYTSNKLQWKGTLIRYQYINLCSEKIMDTDFQNVENPEGQEKMRRAVKLMDAFKEANNLGYRVMGAHYIIYGLAKLFGSVFGVISYGIIIFTLSPWLILLLVACTILDYLIEKRFTDYNYNTRSIWRPMDKKINYIKLTLADTSKAKDVHLYNISKWMTDFFTAIMKARGWWHMRIFHKNVEANGLSALLGLVRDILAFGLLLYMIVTRGMPVSDFVLYLGIIGGFSGLLLDFAQGVQGVYATSLEFCDYREFLDMPDKLNRTGGAKTTKTACEIAVKNVSFAYGAGQADVIKNLSFTINKGEKIAVVGTNGAGKTTLVKLICGLYAPTNGEISLNGENMLHFNRDEYYTQFSAVFQDIYLLPASIAKNIAMCKTELIDHAHVMDCLKRAGLLDKVQSLPEKENTLLIKAVHENGIELSGGEKQKLALARALYKDGSMVILDEPTAALDPIAENELYLKYSELTMGKTSLFISHRLSSTRFCDRIFFLDGGEITEVGTHEQLMANKAKYAEMFAVQSHYYNNPSEVQDEKAD